MTVLIHWTEWPFWEVKRTKERPDAPVSGPGSRRVHFTKGDGCHINPMPRVTKGVIEVARESVVIGPL